MHIDLEAEIICIIVSSFIEIIVICCALFIFRNMLICMKGVCVDCLSCEYCFDQDDQLLINIQNIEYKPELDLKTNV